MNLISIIICEKCTTQNEYIQYDYIEFKTGNIRLFGAYIGCKTKKEKEKVIAKMRLMIISKGLGPLGTPRVL